MVKFFEPKIIHVITKSESVFLNLGVTKYKKVLHRKIIFTCPPALAMAYRNQ